MAKKKVSKKKPTRTTGRKTAGSGAKSKARTMKKKAAPSSSKKKKKKTSKKSVSKKSTTKKKSSTKISSTKKGSTKKSSSKKTPTRKKTVSPSAAKKTTSKTTIKKTTSKKVVAKTSRKTLGKRGKTVVNPIPDSDGYVMINGRRVRMMSVTPPPPPARKVTRKTPTAATVNKEVKTKPRKTRLKSKQLDEFQDLLLTKRSELIGDLSALEEQALKSGGGNSSHMPIHMADIGSDTYDQDFMEVFFFFFFEELGDAVR